MTDVAYVVFRETSDQYGTLEVVGVYSGPAEAAGAVHYIERCGSRACATIFNVNARPVPPYGMRANL